MSTVRLPTYFISHGGGPWPWMKEQMGGVYDQLEAALARMPADMGATPRAVLMLSAHWEEPRFTVQTHPNPPMLYDYGGFPDFTYRIGIRRRARPTSRRACARRWPRPASSRRRTPRAASTTACSRRWP